MNRHDLKEQLQHDPFKDSVAKAVDYTSTHRTEVVRWALIGLAVLLVVGAGIWYASYRRSVREQDLENAFAVLAAPIGPPNQFGKSFATEDARRSASLKALSDVIQKDGDSREGNIALYYRGTLKAQSNDASGAEADLRKAANGSGDSVSLAKIALAQLYSGQNRIAEAQTLLRSLVDKPSGLVSKQQAQILLAQMEQSSNPQDARKILKSLQTPDTDPAISRAAAQVSAEIPK